MKKEIKAVSRESDKFMLRFPDGMRDRIAEEAKQNNRSMNAEIIERLEASFSKKELSENFDVQALSLRVLDMLRKERSTLENIVLRNYQAMAQAVAELETSGESQAVLERLQREVRGLSYVIEALDADRKTPEEVRAHNLEEFQKSPEAEMLRTHVDKNSEPESSKPKPKRIVRTARPKDDADKK